MPADSLVVPQNRLRQPGGRAKRVEQANTISAILTDRHETLAVAESVTAGYVQAILSSAEEASFFFQGGITTYNIGQKCRHLLIDPIEAVKTNCVSAKVALQMSLGVQTLFMSDYGIGITGYAAPLPEKGIDEIFGYVAATHKGSVLPRPATTGIFTLFPQACANLPVEHPSKGRIRFFVERTLHLLNSMGVNRQGEKGLFFEL